MQTTTQHNDSYTKTCDTANHKTAKHLWKSGELLLVTLKGTERIIKPQFPFFIHQNSRVRSIYQNNNPQRKKTQNRN